MCLLFWCWKSDLQNSIFSIGKFGVFKKKTECCVVCYGKGRVHPHVLFDLEQDCRTFH